MASREMLGSNWWIALILGALLTLFGVIVILNPMLGLGVIGVLVGCGVITAGVNLILSLGCSPGFCNQQKERNKTNGLLRKKIDIKNGKGQRHRSRI